jgi:hypothetical protein
MRALLAAAVLLAAAAGAASAQGAKRDVLVESDPPGADVYLNSKDEGSICKTPCTIKAPVGDQVIIIEIENHVSLVESLVVPKRGKPVARFKLVRAVGTIVVKGPEGASIRIGDADKGKAPAKLEVDAGPHTITLTLNGKQVLQDLVEVEANQEVVVRGKEVAGAPDPGPDDPEVIDGGDGTDPGGTGKTGLTGVTGVTKAATPRPARGKYIAVSGLIDIGFRYFRYKGVITTDTLPDESEKGQVLGGPMIELWPGTLAGVRALRGLALVARFELPINKQQVKDGGLSGPTTTFWQSLEVSARQRWTPRGKGTVEVGAGFVRDQHQFNTNTNDLKLVPDTDYRMIRIGVRGSLLLGALEPYFAAENRIVLSGGRVMEGRFSRGATASGLRAALGATAKLGPLDARLEGAINRYSWTFKYENMDMYKAEGASDSILMISAALSYAY